MADTRPPSRSTPPSSEIPENLDPFILTKLDEISKTLKEIQKVQAATLLPGDFATNTHAGMETANKHLKNIGCGMTFFVAIALLAIFGFLTITFVIAK